MTFPLDQHVPCTYTINS
jgi:8-oxo-dGTP pyrophosphatase MutT (NUDIX family)